MSIRAIEIKRLHGVADRKELLPAEIRQLSTVLIFEILYDAKLFEEDPSARGGSWGLFFDHKERRAARVLLNLKGYIETFNAPIRKTEGEVSSTVRYVTSEKGRRLLNFLKSSAGIE